MSESELSRAAQADDIEAVATAVARDENMRVSARSVALALDGQAEMLRPSFEGVDPLAKLGRLIRGVYKELGYRTPERYDAPRYHQLDRVIETRVGSPVALAVVLIALGRRFDVEVSGVAFPGHFMARYEGSRRPIFIDPATGAFPFPSDTLTELAQRELRVGKDEARRFLNPVDARTIGVRLLQNLLRAYEERGDRGRAMLVYDRLYELTGSPSALSHRGLRAAALGATHAAAADLHRYLEEHRDQQVSDTLAKLSVEPDDLN